MTPKQHYANGIRLLDTIVEHKDDEAFDVRQAQALATAALAQFVGGLIEFLTDLDPYIFYRRDK